jgi:hypothetical protein
MELKNFYVDEKFIVIEKGDYNGKYYFIRKVEIPDIMHLNTIMGKDTIRVKLVLTKKDTLFTVLTEQNFMYNRTEKWDQFYFTYNVNDTLIATLNKNRFWKKLK